MIKVHYILILFTLYGCSETFDSSYSTLDDAKKAEVIGSWLPKCLPPSSYDIKERHNIDTNFGWIHFRFEPKDSTTFLNNIRSVPEDSIQFLELETPSLSWWHTSLKSNRLKEAFLKNGFSFFTVQYNETNQAGTVFTSDWCFALRMSEGVGYGWLLTSIKIKSDGAQQQ